MSLTRLQKGLGDWHEVTKWPYCLYTGASLVAQLVKDLPAMQETPVQFLGQEDPLEEGMATHPSILAWRMPMDRGLQTVGSQRVRTLVKY